MIHRALGVGNAPRVLTIPAAHCYTPLNQPEVDMRSIQYAPAQSARGSATLIDLLLPHRSLLADAALIVGFAAFTAVFAQIAIKLPFTPVPITGQTLAVLVTGGALGANRGAASLALYMLVGMVGLPVFAPSLGEGTVVHFILPWQGSDGFVWNIASGGYIVGFVAAAWIVGRLAERGWDRSWRVLLAMLAGNVALYAPGLLWLGWWAVDQEWTSGAKIIPDTLQWGLWPFVAGDLAKLYVASVALPGAWALARRLRAEDD